MSKILKNSTGSIIEIEELGIIVPASSQITVQTEDYLTLASADCVSELTPFINSGDLVVNNGSSDLAVAEALIFIRSSDDAETIIAKDPNSLNEKTVQGQLDKISDTVFNPVENDLVALQVVLDNNGLNISNNSWQSLPFNTTIIQNDSSTIDLNPSDDEEIRIKKDGLYLVSYNVNVEQPDENKPDEIEFRVVQNGSQIDLSERTFKVEHKNLFGIISHGFLIEASAGDTLNLQVINNDSKDYELKNQVVFFAVKLSNATGPSASTETSRSDLIQGGVCELIHTVSQSLTGTGTVLINWGQSDVIDANHYSFSGNVITFNKAGRYKVMSKVNFDLNGGARARVLNRWQHAVGSGAFSNIAKSVSYCYMRANNASDDGTCNSMFTYEVASGDRLRLSAQNSANNSQTIANESNVYIEFLGKT